MCKICDVGDGEGSMLYYVILCKLFVLDVLCGIFGFGINIVLLSF